MWFETEKENTKAHIQQAIQWTQRDASKVAGVQGRVQDSFPCSRLNLKPKWLLRQKESRSPGDREPTPSPEPLILLRDPSCLEDIREAHHALPRSLLATLLPTKRTQEGTYMEPSWQLPPGWKPAISSYQHLGLGTRVDPAPPSPRGGSVPGPAA